MCTPGALFCEGTKLWACTKTGTDAVLTSTCTGGSATNPVGCFTTQCPSGSAGCCRPSKPECSWNLTSPTATSGSFFSYDPAQPWCSISSHCAQDASFSVTLMLNPGALQCPKPTYRQFSLTLKRPIVTPGEIISLPNSRVSLWVLDEEGTNSCSAWTGTLTWNSDVPSWSITLNATCSETGKSGIKLVGTFSGDQ